MLPELGGIEDANAAVIHASALVRGVVEMRLELAWEAEIKQGVLIPGLRVVHSVRSTYYAINRRGIVDHSRWLRTG